MYKCEFCKKPITILQRFLYAFDNLLGNHILTDFGGRITDSYWYWKDITDLSKGKEYFHNGCWEKDYQEREQLAKDKSNLKYYIKSNPHLKFNFTTQNLKVFHLMKKKIYIQN